MDVFKNIISYVREIAPAEFVFSGGEPLMDKERLFEMITAISQEGLSRYISVQTNATLLDTAAVEFFLEHKVNLEVGIDGDESTTQRNRPGIGPYYYRDIVRGVDLVLKSKGLFTTTMVVHPSGVGNLFENLKYLASKGLKTIETHPAFLEDWKPETSAVFLDQYRKACAWELKEGRQGLIGRGYSQSSKGSWDLLSVPSGKVLANWLLLSFPEDVREHLYLMDFSQGPKPGFLPQAKPYFKALEEHIETYPHCSYRSISNFNAAYAVRTPPGRKYEIRVKEYFKLCDAIEAIDHKIMGVGTWR